MTEATKTVAIVVAALAVLFMGFITRPKPPVVATGSMVGQKLFPKLDDPLTPKRIRITTYDETTGEPKEFEVAQADGVWSLPSHQNYPADAKEQMASAATALFGMKVLGEVSDDPEKHELYGVVEPDKAKNQIGQKKGIGKLVEMEDKAKNSLARLIIGKEDKAKSADDFGSPQSKLRFVRLKGQDRVYRVEMASDKFSTKFENWIETDLLKLNPWDISQVDLRDYSVQKMVTADGELGSALNPKADIDLGFNDKDSKWDLKKLVVYKKGQPVAEKLAADQELNTTKLNEMKTALDDLKIVNVQRKPARMSANMKAGADFMNDREALIDLYRRGFTPSPISEKEFEIKANDGEAIVGMKDGIEYVLRFGNIAGIDGNSGEDEEAADAKKADGKAADKDNAADKAKDAATVDAESDTLKVAEKKGASVNRYVMVMARFNANLLAKPELEKVPEIKKAPEKKDDAAKGAAKADAAKKSDEAKPKDDEAKKGSSETNAEEDLEAQEARRDKIEKENKRKQDEYDEKVKKGEERAKELNARFADWYYVISDATYRKIHLGVDDIVVTKPKDEKSDKAGVAAPPDPFNSPKGTSKAAPAAAGKK